MIKAEYIDYVSVIMPVYNQATFVKCAIGSLLSQTHTAWELVIVDDGSTDNLHDTIICFFSDERIKYFRNEKNEGLGYSLNKGIESSSFSLISYLPADDLYFNNHLESLVAKLGTKSSDMVFSGLVYNTKNIGGENNAQQSYGKIENLPLQLVQVLHKKTEDRWVERSEFVTDDLGRMFWTKFQHNNSKISCTGVITCEWVSHLYQRHNIMNDHNCGGIYMYKTYYGVREPIRFQSSTGNYIDEISHYQLFREIEILNKENGLKILLVGELSYNPERISALEARGHKLYGLWINNPLNFNSVGHFPFGNVEDVPFENWEQRVKEIQPDVIYALLNFKAIDLAHHVLSRNLGIPFVWHFKEGPFYCRTLGLWNKLMDLYEKSDGAIFTNETIHDWFNHFLRAQNRHIMILDGDLPPKEWFSDSRKELLSDTDGEIHTVIAGRLLGFTTDSIEALADQNVHLHIYGDVFHNQSKMLLDEAMALAPDHIHLHPNCPAENWVSEFSQYDAGWLHYFESNNNGELMRANWIDINSPARMATYAMAGIPMIMHNNKGHIVHHQKYLESYNMAIAIDSFRDLKRAFADKGKNRQIRESVWDNRKIFCFDHYAESLISFFREVIEGYSKD